MVRFGRFVVCLVIEVYNSIFESIGYGISDTSSNLIVRGNNQILYNDIFDNFGDGIETLGKPVVNYNNITYPNISTYLRRYAT